MTAVLDPRPPAELRALSDLIGDEATLLLVEQLGGNILYVPKQVNQGTRLSRLIGPDAARGLAVRHGGEHLRIPLAKHWCARVYRRRGGTIAEIAHRLRVGENTVSRYLSRDRAAGIGRGGNAGQFDLFASPDETPKGA